MTPVVMPILHRQQMPVPSFLSSENDTDTAGEGKESEVKSGSESHDDDITDDISFPRYPARRVSALVSIRIPLRCSAVLPRVWVWLFTQEESVEED